MVNTDNQTEINAQRGERLKKLREFLGFKDRMLSKFAISIEYESSNLTSIEKGKKTLPLSIVEILSNRYNVNSDWLLYGNGDMIRNNTQKENVEISVTNRVLKDGDFHYQNGVETMQKELQAAKRATNHYKSSLRNRLLVIYRNFISILRSDAAHGGRPSSIQRH